MAKKTHEWVEKKFTKLIVRQLEKKRRDGDFPYWGIVIPEEYLPRFSIKVNKRYSSYGVRVHRQFHPIGQVGLLDLDEARQQARGMLKVLDLKGPEMWREQNRTTVAELAQRHLEWIAEGGEGEKKKNTRDQYQRDWGHLLDLMVPLDLSVLSVRQPLGQLKLAQVTKDHVRWLRGEYEHAHYLWNRFRALLSLTWQLAEDEWDMLPAHSNIVRGVKTYKVQRRQLTNVEPQHYLDVLTLADQWVAGGLLNVTIANLWWTMYYTGWRPSETLRLREEDVDWDRSTVTFVSGKTIESPVKKHLPVALHARLRDGMDSGWLFPGGRRAATNQVGPMVKGTVDRAWRTLREAAGHPELVMYTFRHNFRTQMVEAGLPPELAADVMGHTTVTMSETYRHTPQSKTHTSAAHMAEHMERLAHGSHLRLVERDSESS